MITITNLKIKDMIHIISNQKKVTLKEAKEILIKSLKVAKATMIVEEAAYKLITK